MELQQITLHKQAFDSIMKTIVGDEEEQIEVWFARELQTVLGYARWENF